MKILVTNRDLSEYGGSQTFTFTLVENLLKKGHEVHLYTNKQGEISNRLVKLGASLNTIKKFDLMLIQHISPRGIFSKKKLQIIHGVQLAAEKPKKSVDGYISLSSEITENLKNQGLENITQINQPINLDRFKKQTELNPWIQNILALTQGKEATELVKECANDIGVKVNHRSKWTNRTWELENEINKADLVISYGRGVAESLACGRPVIVFDSRNYTDSYSDGYIQREHHILESMKNNFSGRRFKIKLNKQSLLAEIHRYNPVYSDGYRLLAERELNVDNIVDKIINA